MADNANTLNLADGNDGVEVIEDAERVFGIRIGNEASDALNVGQLYDLILRKHRAARPRTRACLTQAAFHRLRFTLQTLAPDHRITPATPLSALISTATDTPTVRRMWDGLGKRAGLTLPPLEIAWGDGPMSRLQSLASLIVAVGLFLLLVGAFQAGGFSVGGAMGSALLAMFALGTIVPWMLESQWATVPNRIKTVGDLAREAAGHSFVELQREKGGCSPTDIWFGLTAVLRFVSGRKGPINRDTTFFAQT